MNNSRKDVTTLMSKILQIKAHAEINITDNNNVVFSFPTESVENVKKLGLRDRDFTRCFRLRKNRVGDPISFNHQFQYLEFIASADSGIPHNSYIYITMGVPNFPRNRIGMVFDLSEVTPEEMGTTLQFCNIMINRCKFKKHVKMKPKEKRIEMHFSI